MILNSIDLENIRSYQKERIEFPRGITLFEGDIGSGKSTVLMGIEFALFGLGSQKPESLLSKKASEGSVILEFEVDEKRYVVKRKLKRKGDSVSQDAKESYLIYDGQTEPLSPSELKQRILKILKFNEPADPRSESRIFRYAVFTPQEEMKQILRDAGRRLETIRKAFGVEDYRVITENAKHLSSTMRERMAAVAVRFERAAEDEHLLTKSKQSESQLEQAIGDLDAQKKSLDARMSEVEKEIASLEDQAKQKQTLLAEKEKIEEQIKGKISTVSVLKSQASSAMKDAENIDSDLLDLGKTVRPTTRDISDIDVQISSLSALRDRMLDGRAKVASLESDLASLRKDLGDFVHLSTGEPERARRYLEGIREEIKIRDKEHDDLDRKKITLEKERMDILAMLSELQGLGAKCPHCEHNLTPEHKKNVEAERRTRLGMVESDLGSVASDLAVSCKRLDDLRKTESEQDLRLRQIERTAPLRDQWFEKNRLLDVLKKEIPELESQFTVKEEAAFPLKAGEDAISYLRRLRDAQKEYANSQQRISELDMQKQKLEKIMHECASSIDDLEESVARLSAELEGVLGGIAKFADVERLTAAISKEHAELRQQTDDLHTRQIRSSQILENERQRILDLEKKIVEAQEWKARHQKLSNYYLWLREFFIPAVDRIEKQVLLSIQQGFDETYRKWYSVLVDDVTKESRIDESFAPLVEQDGFLQDVEFLSGGEKTSIALAYRLALNSMMRQESEGLKSNLLILDEPTDGFSKAQLSKVRNLLHELRSQQIILVSHEKELEAYVDNIFQISKDSGVSRVTHV